MCDTLLSEGIALNNLAEDYDEIPKRFTNTRNPDTANADTIPATERQASRRTHLCRLWSDVQHQLRPFRTLGQPTQPIE
jgi:hypothetical protein